MSKPDSPQGFSYKIELETGDYWWCACGKSKIQPLCDGSHQSTEVEPVKFTITDKKTVILCGCEKTNNPPYCDGSHNKI